MRLDERTYPQIVPTFLEADDSWRADAACRGADPALFYADRGEDSRGAVAAAKAICDDCPVCGACLDYALDTGQEFGVWGGRSPKERRLLRRMLRPYGRRRAV